MGGALARDSTIDDTRSTGLTKSVPGVPGVSTVNTATAGAQTDVVSCAGSAKVGSVRWKETPKVPSKGPAGALEMPRAP